MRPILLVTVLLLPLVVDAAPVVPPDLVVDVPLPAGYVLNPDADVVDYDAITLNVGDRELRLEGMRAYFSARADPPLGQETPAAAATWAAALRKAGWQIDTTAPSVIAHRVVPGRNVEAWVDVWCFGSEDIRGKLIEKVPYTTRLELPPPRDGAMETPADKDIPFLARFPGNTQLLGSTAIDSFDVTAEGDPETKFVGPAIGREYRRDRPISGQEFLRVYKTALKAAGWTILREAAPGDAVIVAHYARDGRDVWVTMHAGGTDMAWHIADVGAAAAATKLAAELKRKGHVALYGIYFDTDSARLKPESDATLRQVLQLLQGDPTLKLEVQGHTDASGTRARNQPLSQARAASVRAWLTKAGVAAARLTPAGYADTKPVATNDTPQGRALNRRVELMKR